MLTLQVDAVALLGESVALPLRDESEFVPLSRADLANVAAIPSVVPSGMARASSDPSTSRIIGLNGGSTTPSSPPAPGGALVVVCASTESPDPPRSGAAAVVDAVDEARESSVASPASLPS